MSAEDPESLKVFTLNCWGLRYVSDHRPARIKLIAQHLSESDYDIVFLQELWIQSDFDYIRSKTKSKYRFAHMFNNASLLGTSGLIIMSRWMPNFIHFYPFSVNGSPFQPCHGDWFSRKGVGYARIELNEMNLHLFCVHMHAQYDSKEKVNDQYSIHRICQAYELGKFVNLMSHSSGSSTSKDLIILAGDMNVSSKELPYKVLVATTGLQDCQKHIQSDGKDKSHKERKTSEESDSESDSESATCGHHSNTFTPKEDLKAKVPGKRIDFIFFKISCFKEELDVVPEKIPVVAKDKSGLSFSDHQPVAFKMVIKKTGRRPSLEDGAEKSYFARRNKKFRCEIKIKNPELIMRYKTAADQAKPTNDSCKRLKSPDLALAVEDLLSSYIDKFQSSFKYVTLMVTVAALICLLTLLILKLMMDLTYTEMFLMIVILLMVTFIAAVLKFVAQRTEINAVKAILNDINRRTSLWDLNDE